MIRLQSRLFENLQDSSNLLSTLQTALELEHATIPPYLVAAYSLDEEKNPTIRELMLDVAREEMLHMTLVCNLINALGGTPRLNSPDFIPNYPTHLPGAVQDDLVVPLAPFSIDVLQQVFMRIEEPEKPQVFPVVAAAVDEPKQTIGEFYALLRGIIQQGGEAMFTGDPLRQVERRIGDDRSTKVTDVASALGAIDLIIEQGEGTTATPLEAATGEPAHYYRFAGIVHGRTLQRDASVLQGFSYSGAVIKLDSGGVFPVKANLTVTDLPGDSAARGLAEDFNRKYTEMLGELHRGFNGEPLRIGLAVNIMRNNLPNLAAKLVATEIEPGVNAGPTFEFAPLN